MSSISVFDFNSNNIRFENRNGRAWVNLTDMAKASGKLIGNWNQLISTKEFLTEFESVIGIAIIESRVGGNFPENERGTWAIEEVALEFAGWCSVQFKIWMLTQIKTLMTQGTVSLNPEPKSKISPALLVAREYSEIQSLVSDNPRLAQLLIDSAVNHHLGEQKAISGTNLKGVVEIAGEMGYKTNHSSRVKLGSFIANQGFNQKKESRLCNGIMREINCYEDSPELRKAIKDFFS